jgi:hypothetical protein
MTKAISPFSFFSPTRNREKTKRLRRLRSKSCVDAVYCIDGGFAQQYLMPFVQQGFDGFPVVSVNKMISKKIMVVTPTAILVILVIAAAI